MIIDERFTNWLKLQNLTPLVGDKIVKESLFKWYGFISDRVPNMNKKKMSNYQYLCVFVEFYQSRRFSVILNKIFRFFSEFYNILLFKNILIN